MQLVTGKAFGWTEIDQTPQTTGVYAWYSKLVIAKADLDETIAAIERAKLVSDSAARETITQALDRFIFNPYQESPYQVSLRGPLKPRFGGHVAHEPTRSDSLVKRIMDDPKRLQTVASVLATAAPGFTAPLYIGMALNLRQRLCTHKRKIIELRDNQLTAAASDGSPEAGFANQIVERRFDPTNLFVLITEVPVETGEHNDIENILNRINYPIFGRN